MFDRDSWSHFLLVFHTEQYTMWKLLQFSLTHFWQKFREINVFTKEITKELIRRNIFLVRPNFSFFHTVVREFNLKFLKIREIDCTRKKVYRNYEKKCSRTKKGKNL